VPVLAITLPRQGTGADPTRRRPCERYVADGVGLLTLQDIFSELRRPGRDPREQFQPPAFRNDVKEPKDLAEAWCSRASSLTLSRSAHSLIMLAAETEAAGVLQLSTYVRGLTVPNSKTASD
jgi:hypothetical protein